MGKKVIAEIDEAQKKRLYHLLLDQNKSFTSWLRDQIDAYLAEQEPKVKRKRKES